MKMVGVMVLLASGLCLARIGEGTVGISGSFVLPADEFADDRGDFRQNGYANPGFGGGVDFAFSLGHPSVELLSSGLVLFSFLDRDELEEEWTFAGWTAVEGLDGGDYFSIPFLVGPRLLLPIDGLQPYIMAQLGLNILMQTELEGTVSGSSVEGDISFDPTVSFALSLGAGFLIDESVNLGFRFLYLGEPEVDYEASAIGYTGRDEREVGLSVFQFFVGYQF